MFIPTLNPTPHRQYSPASMAGEQELEEAKERAEVDGSLRCCILFGLLCERDERKGRFMEAEL